MASNLNFTMKRHNGTDIDTLYPKTITGQVIGLQAALDAKVSTSLLGAASGVATLDASGKVNVAQIPDYVMGGMKFKNGISLSTPVTVDAILASQYLMNPGDYVIVTTGGNFTQGTTTTGTIQSPGDAGDSTFPVTLESGDWIVLIARDIVGNTATFAIVDNTAETATTSVFGMTRLSSITVTTSASGNNVITDSVIAGLVGTGAGKIAAGDHLHTGVYQPLDSDLTAIAGLAATDGNFIVGNGSSWVAESGATARDSLGLTIGTHVQAYDAGLQSISGLTTAANKMIYTTGADAYAVTDLSAFARTLLDDADAQTARATLGLTYGLNVQAWDSTGKLDAIAAASAATGNFLIGDGTVFASQTPAIARSTLSVYSTTEVNNLLTNRPEIFYNTTTGTGVGDLIIADVVAA